MFGSSGITLEKGGGRFGEREGVFEKEGSAFGF